MQRCEANPSTDAGPLPTAGGMATGEGEDAAAATAPAPPRRGRALLLDPVFGPFVAAKLLATIGVWVHNIAAAILVFELTRSALLVGAVSVGQFLPQLLLTPLSGARADRGDRRRQIIVGRLVTTSGSLGLVTWAMTVGLDGTAGAAAVIVAATVVGIGFALGGPAMSAIVPALVRRSELPAAITLSTAPFTIARVTGPAIGALLVATTGATAAFGVAAAANLVFALVIWRLPVDLTPRRTARDTSIRAGWRFVRQHATIGRMLIGVAAIGVGADPIITLTPSLADRLGAGSALVGALASSFGAGAGVTFLAMGALGAWLGLERVATMGIVAMTIGVLGLAVAPDPNLAIMAAVIGGSGMTMGLTSLTTLVQQQVPDEFRGRVMALWSVAFLGSRPLAAGSTGALADLASVGIALLLVAGVLVLGAVVARPSRTRAAPEQPSRSDQGSQRVS